MAHLFCANVSGLGQATSENGVDWVATTQISEGTIFWSAAAVSTGHAVIGGDSFMHVTEDSGATWIASSFINRGLSSIITNSRFICGTFDGTVVHRPFGGSFTIESDGGIGSTDSAASSAVSIGSLVGLLHYGYTGGSGNYSLIVRRSTDGGATWGNWEYHYATFGLFKPHASAVFNGYVIVCGQNPAGGFPGKVYTSTDLVTWTLRYTTSGVELHGLMAFDDRVLAWDDLGGLHESFDGLSWSAVSGETPFAVHAHYFANRSKGVQTDALGILMSWGGPYQSFDYMRTYTDIHDEVTTNTSIFLIGPPPTPVTRFWTDYVQAVETPT